MLSKLREFSKSKLAIVLVAIIIIPFVFWGMGSVFSGGNKNNIAKINNENISTSDFIEYVNNSRINPEDLRKNLDKNILQEILSQLISLNLIDLEIKDIGIIITDESLVKIITNDEKFKDENNNFSRIKYEKFLLENNTNTFEYEKKLKDSELQKHLFQYIIGGITSPSFLTKNYFLEENKVIKLKYINLEPLYKKEFSRKELDDYINENKKELNVDLINFSYSKLKPNDLTSSDEFNKEYFDIIENIDNDIISGEQIEILATKYGFKIEKVKDYLLKENDEKDIKFIYENRNGDKVKLIDQEDYFLVYEITNIKKTLRVDNPEFINKVKNKLRSKEKFNFNKKILKKIETENFNDTDFNNVSTNINDYKEAEIKSKDDTTVFNVDSLNLIYSLPKNDYALIIDNNKNVYLTKITDFKYKQISEQSDEFRRFNSRNNFRLKNYLSSTYDEFLNNKYKIEINQNTIERLKNYFK